MSFVWCVNSVIFKQILFRHNFMRCVMHTAWSSMTDTTYVDNLVTKEILIPLGSCNIYSVTHLKLKSSELFYQDLFLSYHPFWNFTPNTVALHQPSEFVIRCSYVCKLICGNPRIPLLFFTHSSRTKHPLFCSCSKDRTEIVNRSSGWHTFYWNKIAYICRNPDEVTFILVSWKCDMK